MYHAPVICSRRLHPVIALMLPIMVLHAMLPVGYMTVADQGQLRIVMCSGGLAPAIDDHGRQPTRSTTDCLFALAHATGAAPPVQPPLAPLEPPPAVQILSLAATQLPPAAGPPRTTAVRGPPASLLKADR